MEQGIFLSGDILCNAIAQCKSVIFSRRTWEFSPFWMQLQVTKQYSMFSVFWHLHHCCCTSFLIVWQNSNLRVSILIEREQWQDSTEWNCGQPMNINTIIGLEGKVWLCAEYLLWLAKPYVCKRSHCSPNTFNGLPWQCPLLVLSRIQTWEEGSQEHALYQPGN